MGGELRDIFDNSLSVTYIQTDILAHTDPPTKRVLEELSLLKITTYYKGKRADKYNSSHVEKDGSVLCIVKWLFMD